MKIRLISEIISLALVLGLASGCNGTNFSSGLSEEKSVDALTVEEQDLYCASLNDFVTDMNITEMVRSIACRSLGLTAMFGTLTPEDNASLGTESASCEEVYELCMAATNLEGFEAPEFPCSEGDWESCNITVGELESCISEITVLLDDTDNFLSCNLISMVVSASDSTFEGIAQVQSCIALATGCSGFMPTVETEINSSSEPNQD
jgi:hypothetical protein